MRSVEDTLDPSEDGAVRIFSQMEAHTTSKEKGLERSRTLCPPEERALLGEAAKRKEAEAISSKRQRLEARQAEEAGFTAEAFEELMAAAQEAAWSMNGSQADREDGLSQCEELPGNTKGAASTDGSGNSQCFHRRIQAILAPVFCSSTRALQVKEVSKAICDVMLLSQDELHLCRPQPIAGKMDLYPLPAADITDDPEDPFFSLRALTFGLNSLAGLGVALAP